MSREGSFYDIMNPSSLLFLPMEPMLCIIARASNHPWSCSTSTPIFIEEFDSPQDVFVSEVPSKPSTIPHIAPPPISIVEELINSLDNLAHTSSLADDPWGARQSSSTCPSIDPLSPERECLSIPIYQRNKAARLTNLTICRQPGRHSTPWYLDCLSNLLTSTRTL